MSDVRQTLLQNRLHQTRAFSAVEILAVILVLGLLLFVLVPSAARARAKSERIRCVGRLKNVGLSFRIFATENKDQFPSAQYLTNATALSNLNSAIYFSHLSNELSTPILLHCPADKRRLPAASFGMLTASNISYFISLTADETRPQVLLAGDRNLVVNGKPIAPGLLALSTNDTVAWSRAIHRGQGNVVMGDGSVQQFSALRLQKALPDQGVATNLLLIP